MLCNLDNEFNQIVDTYEYWTVIENKFPYKRWDWMSVDEHLMAIPKRHVVALDELNEDEWSEFNAIASEYDAEAYSLYVRSQANPIKSITHLHWHLLKVE